MPRLLRSAPYFPVADVLESAAYYREVYGFATEYLGPRPRARVPRAASARACR